MTACRAFAVGLALGTLLGLAVLHYDTPRRSC